MEETARSRRHVKKILEAIFDSQEVIAPVARIAKNETKKAVDVESKREDRYH